MDVYGDCGHWVGGMPEVRRRLRKTPHLNFATHLGGSDKHAQGNLTFKASSRDFRMRFLDLTV